jgi:dihydrofolate reductase
MALEYNRIDEMYITYINKEYGADTFFPTFDEEQWKSEEILRQDRDEKHEADFFIMKYFIDRN